jgi:tripartite-type tricarboxylate transporter receptor subunit TctC
MKARSLAVAIAAMMLSIAGAAAQTYPSRPITFVTPFPPAGALDTLGRVLAESMQRSLGQPVVVENVPGANGSIGTARVVRAAPDGYTVGLGYWGSHVANGVLLPLQYDLLKDLEPVALVATSAPVLVAKNVMPANDLKELIAWLKANPGKASQGTAGAASAAHVAGLLLQKETGAQYQFIPYRGGAAAMQDVLAGHIDMLFMSPDVVLPHVRAGKVKAYAVTGKKRLPAAPDIPTADEAGVPGFDFALWFGLWVPKSTPKENIIKLNAAAAAALAEPAIVQKLGQMGFEVPSPEEQTPEALGAFQKAEIEKWWPILKAANIKLD